MRLMKMTRGKNWTRFLYDATYPMSWRACLAYAERVYLVTDEPEVLVAEIAGAEEKKVTVEKPEDIRNIPEAGVITVRGYNGVFDNVKFQQKFYNQSRAATLEVPTQFMDDITTDKDTEKEHVFDVYMTSIEITGEVEWHKQRFAEYLAALSDMLTGFRDFSGLDRQNVVFKDNYTDIEVNASEIIKKIIENYEQAKK